MRTQSWFSFPVGMIGEKSTHFPQATRQWRSLPPVQGQAVEPWPDAVIRSEVQVRAQVRGWGRDIGQNRHWQTCNAETDVQGYAVPSWQQVEGMAMAVKERDVCGVGGGRWAGPGQL